MKSSRNHTGFVSPPSRKPSVRSIGLLGRRSDWPCIISDSSGNLLRGIWPAVSAHYLSAKSSLRSCFAGVHMQCAAAYTSVSIARLNGQQAVPRAICVQADALHGCPSFPVAHLLAPFLRGVRKDPFDPHTTMCIACPDEAPCPALLGLAAEGEEHWDR